jgi:hypothetical protein
MRARKARTTALGVTLAVALLGAQVAPTPALAGLRALDCCANTCHHADPMRAAKRCCVNPQHSQSATLARPNAPEPPLLAAVAAAIPPHPSHAPGASLDSRDGIRLRAGPIFRLTRSLRL